MLSNVMFGISISTETAVKIQKQRAITDNKGPGYYQVGQVRTNCANMRLTDYQFMRSKGG